MKICVKLADKVQANPWRKEEHAHFTLPQEITILNSVFSNMVCCLLLGFVFWGFFSKCEMVQILGIQTESEILK